MPVETATYIAQLVPANPVIDDPIGQGQQHLNLIKSVLQATFPNATSAFTGTPAGLNAASAAFATAGECIVASTQAGGAEVVIDGVEAAAGATNTGPAGSVILENTGTQSVGSTGPGAGVLTVAINDATNANPVQALTLSQTGALTTPASIGSAAILQNTGTSGSPVWSPLIPPATASGCFISMWSGAANAVPAGWHLCDGTTVNNLAGSAVTLPDLRGLFIVGAGGSYAAGAAGGSSSATATTSSDGSHNHGGADQPAGAYTPTGTTDSQGSHDHTGNTGGYTLQVADIPAHSHSEYVGQGAGGSVAVWNIGANNGVSTWLDGLSTGNTGGGGSHHHNISSDGLHSHNLNVNPLPNHQHNITTDGAHTHTVAVSTLPPYYALCFIAKL